MRAALPRVAFGAIALCAACAEREAPMTAETPDDEPKALTLPRR